MGPVFKKKESPLFQVCQVAIVVYELKRKPCSWLQANLKTFNAVNSLYNVYLYQKLVMLWIGNLCHINVPYETSVSVFYYNYMPTFYSSTVTEIQRFTDRKSSLFHRFYPSVSFIPPQWGSPGMKGGTKNYSPWLPDSENCTITRSLVLSQCGRQTDGQTHCYN